MRSLLSRIKRKFKSTKTGFPGSMDYWEHRYRAGGNSGIGSYDQLAEFKAQVLNSFVKQQGIDTVIEFGCGDGNQLKLAQYKDYIGLDVARTAIRMCMEKFSSDTSKNFFIYDSFAFLDNRGVFKSELAISLDVIYHLVEDDIFERYIRHLFSCGSRYVIIYSSDQETEQTHHVKHRLFAKWISNNIKDWKLKEIIKNKYPEQTTADFFIYERC